LFAKKLMLLLLEIKCFVILHDFFSCKFDKK
jgi:hypothetical protein